MEEIIIRRFREEERQRLKDITVASFANASVDKRIEDVFGQLGSTNWQERKAASIDDDLATNPDGVLVAEMGGEIVGYVTVYINREASLGRVVNLAVDADCRGRGLGRKLLVAADDYMRAEHMTHAKIETLADNEVGNHLYPALGYREIVRQVHFVKKL
ncbi:MAG: GNAT family N-acetyltransferase [Lentisphaeria bacterium]|nr:GNAT family N-acetyltransferase [Lentisphaeria bacterium]